MLLICNEKKGEYERISSNDFLIGNLLPDTERDKVKTHFRSSSRYGKRIEYPELIPFIDKYKALLGESSVKGYLYHLYIDRKFFKEYLPRVVMFLDENGNESDELLKVTHAKMLSTGEVLPVNRFFSEEYYYGDFTKMNTYLVERYRIPLHLDTSIENPGIEEVDYQKINQVLQELEGYMNVPAEEAKKLKVFDLEDLLGFLEDAAINF